MATVDEFIAKLREYIGTPFVHQGRVKGRHGGVDCTGLVVCAAEELDIPITQPKAYHTGDNIEMLETLLHLHCERISSPEKGCLLVYRQRTMYHHLVICTELDPLTGIHAWRTTGINRVVEASIPEEWAGGLHSLWWINGVDR